MLSSQKNSQSCKLPSPINNYARGKGLLNSFCREWKRTSNINVCNLPGAVVTQVADRDFYLQPAAAVQTMNYAW